MYVAVKGGEKAIDNAHTLLASKRRGDALVPELSVEQIRQQMPLAVARVMGEGSLYDEELAALAIKQAAGDLLEAIFLLRAYRTTLPRFTASLPLQTEHMNLERRISATFKDLPGGQLLGPTFDYTHRLLDFSLLAEGSPSEPVDYPPIPPASCPRVVDMLAHEGLLAPETDEGQDVPDITRDSVWIFPVTVRNVYRHWRAAMKVFYWLWVIPHSAATVATIHLRAKSESVRSRSGSNPKSSALRLQSGTLK